jgi:GNAT superfamily N-acetyltransferase
MESFTVEEYTIPASIDAPDAADFVAGVEVRNTVEALGYGTTELGASAAELLPGWQDEENAPRRLFGVRLDGRVVSRAMYERSVGDGTPVAWAAIEVLPEFRGRGIGTALADHVERLAVEDARERLLVYVVSPLPAGEHGGGERGDGEHGDGEHGDGGERIAAPTGFGSVPRDNAEVRFLTRRGYTLEQVERASRLALPVDPAQLDARVEAAAAASGADYAVRTWTGRVPDRWLADMAHLFTRMSTDAPSAGLEEPEDVWTAERVRADDERHAQSPRTMLTAAVEHLPSGRLVGYTSLWVPAEADRSVGQDDTLVLREHRGHRLGMLLKVANLRELQRERPGHPSVITYNAEENRPMLSVNEQLGFVPIGYEGAWRKQL